MSASSIRVLLDENWLRQRARIKAMGFEVFHERAGASDAELADRAMRDGLTIITTDRGFNGLWERMHRRFSVVIVQVGPRNAKWPDLLERAVKQLAEGGGIARVRNNRLRLTRPNGVLVEYRA